MFDRFTDRARKVMGLSRQEAQHFNHDYIGVEHVLLGLTLENSGVAADVLKNLYVDPGKLRQEVEKLIIPGTTMVTMGQLPFTKRAKRMLELSLEEASNLGHNYIGSEHLLLGLIREEEGIAARALRTLNLRVEDVREQIRELTGQGRVLEWEDRLESTAREANAKQGGFFNRFTDRARKVMGLSRQEAQRFNHDYIGTEHILLGLIQEGSGVAADVLKNLDVDPKRIRQEVEKLITYGTTMVTMGQLPFTPRAKKVLEFSLEEADGLGHNYIGTEHLLLGLIREEEGFAARALRTLDVGLEAARREVAKLLAVEVPVPEAPGPRVSGPLTDRARRVMRIAADEAARLRHAEIGTEHILLGLIGEVAPGVLSKVLLRRLRVEAEKLATPGTEPVPKPTFTPGAKKAIKLALEAAHDLGHGGAGPEHLLLGLIGEKEGNAARVLSAAGMTAGEVLEAIAPARKPTAPGLFWLDRLGDRSRRAMALAREEALRLTHDYIGTEHMLLGLVSADGAVAEMLRRLGADPARVRAEIEKRITPGNTMVTTGALPFTPAMKRVLELTREEVNALGHDRVREEHLLLGLLREGRGTAAQVLDSLGVTVDAARKALGPPAPPE